jgi:hypothetical protein
VEDGRGEGVNELAKRGADAPDQHREQGDEDDDAGDLIP